MLFGTKVTSFWFCPLCILKAIRDKSAKEEKAKKLQPLKDDCKDLGFTEADRIENIRRIGEVSKLMTDAGLIVITAFISPFQSERNMVKELVDAGEFIEIFVDTPLQVAEKRDVKGLYAKARAGELKNFTGIDSPYERPSKPEITIDTAELSVDEAADTIVKYYLSSITP